MKRRVESKTRVRLATTTGNQERRLFDLLVELDHVLTGAPLARVVVGVRQQSLTLPDVFVAAEPFYLSDGASRLYWDDEDWSRQRLKLSSVSRRLHRRFAAAAALHREFALLIEAYAKSKEFECRTQPAETARAH